MLHCNCVATGVAHCVAPNKVKYFTLFIYFAFADRYIISISRNSSATLVNLCFLS